MRNGMFCKSGLAYSSNTNEATCVSTSGIWFQGQLLNQPYKCSPQNPLDMCTTKFSIPQNQTNYTSQGNLSSIATKCSCALTDQLSGFCSNIVGTS
jgi:hypothetical protein